MARNMSFALTTDQIRSRTKTVTRRTGWQFLKPGDLINACVKCMGLKPGEKMERLATLRVVDVRRESLEVIDYEGTKANEEAKKEGFPEMSGAEFVTMFCTKMGCSDTTVVTRIEFEYVD